MMLCGLLGCDTQSTKDKSADTAQQVKEASRDAAVKAKEGARQAGKDIKAMAEGVKEGWNEDKNALDLNSCTAAQLTPLGLSQKQAQRVVANRPYKNRHELVTKGVLSEMEYKDIEKKVTTK
jgi:hypothetical protein